MVSEYHILVASDQRQKPGDKRSQGIYVHPRPHVVRCSGHQGVNGVPKGNLEVIPHHPAVRFQVADHRFNPSTLPELRHVDRVHRGTPLEHLLTREVPHVRILHPAGDHPLLTQVVNVLQQHHPNHLPDRDARMTAAESVRDLSPK